ncbi:F-box/kelch-repeat protein At3g06240-like isoform X1 [Prosopis cineraria]|uniref:F-box/kelch-repeat protein At3g06240-like isoform X1 n=1 Tax=Prosopis cineraria TaxID=364024 RepID=UPI00240EF704|nr:F-box/kelch-repeat protein At3g06240-like isoform X1 [Prosopis cineraria]
MQVLELRNDAFIDPIRRPSILGSCNGLICLRLSTYRISLCILVWNPAVREARVTGALSYSENNDYRVGFGFSPTANDYKIVNIRVCSIVDLVNQVEVLTLSTGSWREVEFGSLDRVAVLSNGYNTDGAIFWDAVKLGVDEEGEDDVEVIVSFDIAMEVFTLIPIPSASSAISIAYENKLAMLSHDTRRDSQSSSIHLWVRDEEGTCASGEGCSWVKKCTSNPYLGSLLGPVTVWRNEIVCNLYPSCRPVENDERKIVLFNLTTNEFKTFYIRKSTLSYNIFNYAESLVPVGNIHIE